MKKMMSAAARVAAVSAAGWLAAPVGAQAQVWMELRTERAWSAPEFYEDVPRRVYREDFRPGFGGRDILPRRAIRRILERQGYEVVGRMQFNGAAYVAPVQDRRGRLLRVVVDARDGVVVRSAAVGGAPRPPADIGRARDRNRYAAVPGAEPLPPLPVDPRIDRGGAFDPGFDGPAPPPAASERERLNRERFARQSPDALDDPRGGADDFDVVPGMGPRAAPPAPRATERKAKPAPQRATKPEKPARKQAARPDAAETPQAEKAETPKTEAVKAEPPRSTPPEAKPAREARSTPERQEPKQEAARPAPAPEPAKREAAKPASAKPEAAKTEAAKTEAAKPEAAKPEAAKPEAAKPEAAKPGQAARKAEPDRSNASILRRPSQGAEDSKEGTAKPAQGTVASGPAISTGAEPQRKSPRVVYPGPGAPAPAQPPAASE